VRHGDLHQVVAADGDPALSEPVEGFVQLVVARGSLVNRSRFPPPHVFQVVFENHDAEQAVDDFAEAFAILRVRHKEMGGNRRAEAELVATECQVNPGVGEGLAIGRS
jgi:hypothetical protein